MLRPFGVVCTRSLVFIGSVSTNGHGLTAEDLIERDRTQIPRVDAHVELAGQWLKPAM